MLLRRVRRAVLLLVCIVAAVLLWAILARSYAPRSNTTRQTFDAIVVLGTPADDDGNPTSEMLDRVTEGIHEYQRGVAPRIVFTGGAAHNQFVEAHVMARVAHAQGLPTSNIFEENQAQDTIENVCYSAHMLEEHGWHSFEVVSAKSHLPRASLIVSRLASQQPAQHIEWRMHATAESLTPGYYSRVAYALEVLKTARYLIWARWVETCSP